LDSPNNPITAPAQLSAKAAGKQSAESSQASSKSTKTKKKLTSIVDVLAESMTSNIETTGTPSQSIGKWYKFFKLVCLNNY
jgi:hypothetical protein